MLVFSNNKVKLIKKKIKRRCYALAYDKDGNPKRNVGVFYPDIGMVWEKGME